MKKWLNILICLNMGLLGLVIFLLNDRRKEPVPVALATIPEANQPTSLPTSMAPDTHSSTKPQPFRWSQLESADYQTYVSNLRGIGCPEPTLRDLITADVDAGIYAPRREQLQQKQIGGAMTAALAQHALEAGLQALQKEETALIEVLLGTQPPASQVVADATAPSRSPRKQSKEVPVAMPLVFQNVDLAALKLDTNRLNVIASLRQKFLTEIGGADQDPNDPAYRERWQKAQTDVNNRLKAMIGTTAYQTYEIMSRPAALAQARTGREEP